MTKFRKIYRRRYVRLSNARDAKQCNHITEPHVIAAGHASIVDWSADRPSSATYAATTSRKRTGSSRRSGL